MKIPAVIWVLASLTLFSFLAPVLNCVVAVPSSDVRLLAHSERPVLDATMVRLSLPSWLYATLKQGVGSVHSIFTLI